MNRYMAKYPMPDTLDGRERRARFEAARAILGGDAENTLVLDEALTFYVRHKGAAPADAPAHVATPGQRLRRARALEAMSLSSLARALGCNHKSVDRMERGEAGLSEEAQAWLAGREASNGHA